MKTTCPHCSVHLDIDSETQAALQGQTHFQCPSCNGLVPVPPMTGSQPVAPVRVPAEAMSKPAAVTSKPVHTSTLANAHRGLNRNLLILGGAALLVLGGLGFFLASRGGSIFNTEQKITNEIINNSYFQNLIASGKTTEKELEAIACIRPFGEGFIGISKDDLDWNEALAMARRAGAEILAAEDSVVVSKQQLMKWLATSFPSQLSAPVWVRERAEARVMDGPDILAVTTMNRQRKALFQWGLPFGEGDFVSLFNGRDLTGWFGHAGEDPRDLFGKTAEELQKIWSASMPDVYANWRVEDGDLVNNGKGKFLTTKKNFRNFELQIDYKTVAKADSGIYLRGLPQLQIWDSTDEEKLQLGADKGSGGLWNNNARGLGGKNPSKKMDKPFGEWNAFRIHMIGERVSVGLNGETVVNDEVMENYVDRSSPVFAEGPIKLQTHGGEIRFRNIRIREIGFEETVAALTARDGGRVGFIRLDNGKDLSGWKGEVSDYEVADGAIRCRQGQSGVIYTADEFADFVVQLEFRLPPGGNNGLAIRYPGEGDASYTGMCEVQVLDDNYEKVRGPIDPRQAHGSAYGMIAASRGYQNPPGQWNWQQVTVKGSRVTVELNGFLILDGDLGQVTPDKLMKGHPHPGKDRKSGFFGLAGHLDPVEFRNIWLKKL